MNNVIAETENKIMVMKAALKNYSKQLYDIKQKIGSENLCKYHFLEREILKLGIELDQEREALKFFKDNEKNACKNNENKV